jgi:hypothetical protein
MLGAVVLGQVSILNTSVFPSKYHSLILCTHYFIYSSYIHIIIIIIIIIIILLTFTTHFRVLASSFLRFRDHTQGRTTVGRTPLDEGSARRRDLYLTTHNTHNRKHPCPRRGSNPQSQQASGCRPTP